MRSRSNSKENSSKSEHHQHMHSDSHIEAVSSTGILQMKKTQPQKGDAEEGDSILRSPILDKKQRNYSKKGEDLSRDDLLFLLSVLEGELQVSLFLVSVDTVRFSILYSITCCHQCCHQCKAFFSLSPLPSQRSICNNEDIELPCLAP